MFRIESYITSVILSYVDRYIKNFKRQDVQVSLWEGEGSLHNLDLDLEELDQQLNLPFSFVSGHIHELLIHVPWTRISSEPVQITINTIECIMKLKHPETELTKKERRKRARNVDDCTAPPSYIKSLVNKIIFNVSVTCNNLILKYVEEDIVISMNIKTLSLSTVNRHWEPEFSELTAAQLMMRNLVTLSDVTVCLDKRNASGRIESYLEPILYKCSLVIRISRTFTSQCSLSAATIRVGIKCDHFDLSISDPQVPMLMRLGVLLKTIMNAPPPSNLPVESGVDDSTQSSEGDHYQSWSSWAWAFVPSIFPARTGTPNCVNCLKNIHLGLYLDLCTLDLKLVDVGRHWESLGRIQFENCFLELSHDLSGWSNTQLGICLITVHPVPQIDKENYLLCGNICPNATDSLYENPDLDLQQRPWDVHLSTVTENYMVNRAPALAVDSLTAFEEPTEHSEPRQKVLMRTVLGPLDINVTTGLIERVKAIIESFQSYDYPTDSPLALGSVYSDMSLGTKPETQYFSESYIPKQIMQFTLCEANVRIFAAQVPLPGKKKKKMNAEFIKTYGPKQQPHLWFRLKCLDLSLTKPLHPEDISGLALKDQSMEMFSDAMTTLSAAVLRVHASVLVGDSELIDILDLNKISTTMAYDSILQIEPDSISQHISLQMGELSVNGTQAKLLLAVHILDSLWTGNLNENPIYRTTLVQDSMIVTGIPFLTISLSRFHMMFVKSQVNESLKIRFGSLFGQTYYPYRSQAMKFTVIDSGTQFTNNVFEAIAQRPISPMSTAPFILYVHLTHFHFNVHSSLVDWVIYSPKVTVRLPRLDSTGSKSRKVSSSTVSSLSKKPQEVNERRSEKFDPNLLASIEEFERKVEWLMTWLGIVVSMDFTDIRFSFTSASTPHCVLYLHFPSISVSSSYGKLTVDKDELPVTFKSYVRNTSSFPWSADFNGITGYCMNNDTCKETFLDSFSINSTIAVASKLVPAPSLAVTIHTDTSSVSVSLNRTQICVIADLINSLDLVLNAFPSTEKNSKKPTEVHFEVNQSSDESNSLSQSNPPPPLEESVGRDSVKISCWLQWTWAKFVFSLNTSNSSGVSKLALEMEDIIVSMDMDVNNHVYQKLKVKIGTASIKNFVRESKQIPWRMGSFGGIVMRGHDSSGNNSEFLSLVVTRVLASNFHNKIISHQLVKESARLKATPADRYVWEIDMKLEPLDFVLSPMVLGKFIKVLEPVLLRKPSALGGSGGPGAPLDQYSTADLPLIYLDVQRIRVFIPTSTLLDDVHQDTLVVQIDDVALQHEAINPVTRKILRSDLYASAQRARVTTLPGSQLEDRQYQLDLSIQMSSGHWKELTHHVSGEEREGLDNPAVYWNTAAPTHKGTRLTPLLDPVKMCFILAPPILASGFVISGLNFEGNIITELVVSLNLDQLRLGRHLYAEILQVLPESGELFLGEGNVYDSGIESLEGSVVLPTRAKDERVYRRANSSIVSVSSSAAINTKNLRQRIQIVPTDILLIGKEITLKLYSTDSRTARTQPFVYFSVTQPFINFEKHGDTCIHKASLFDMALYLGSSEHFTNGRIEKNDFLEAFLVTKEGDSDPYKGIPPALINLKSTQIGIKLPAVDVDINRPIKVILKVPNIRFMESIKLLLMDTLQLNGKGPSSMANDPKLNPIREKGKDRVPTISTFNLSTKQIAVEFQSALPLRKKLLVNLSSIVGSVNFPSMNQIYGTFNVNGVVLGVGGRRGFWIVLNPTSFTLNGSVVYEPWLSDPLISCQLTSEVVFVDYSPRQVQIINELMAEFTPLFNSNGVSWRHSVDTEIVEEKEPTKTDDEEQGYTDDLQAGAFQFVNTDPQPELPLAYQVIFPSPIHMAWAYPQPRSISKVAVMPIPFSKPSSESVTVSLQYLDFMGWKDWIKFKVSETQIVKVDLPPKPQVASTWRVVIKTPYPPIHVHSLAGSLRVDSVFSPRLVPNIRLNLIIDCFQISAWAGPIKINSLPHPLSRFAPDNSLPREYPFAKTSLESIKFRILLWKSRQAEIEGDLRCRVDVINSRSLQEQCVVQPFTCHANFLSDAPHGKSHHNLSLVTSPVLVYLAPSIGHTLAAALNNAVLMPIVLCNDTCLPIRIGQAHTNEDITIQCLQCHFYSWRSIQQGMELRFSISSKENWSAPVPVTQFQNYALELVDDAGKKIRLIVVVKKLSSTITQVLLSGELVVHSNLARAVDVRLIANSASERQRYVTVNPGGRAPSIFFCPDSKYNIRLSFDEQWSGLVPLHATSNSYLVKVPSKDKTDFVSVWCQIFKQSNGESTRMMIVISPMYLIKSLLPCDANVLVKTEQLRSERSMRVPGRGAVSNLITPGTTADVHSLTFHIEGNLPSSSPHVPLSYSAMDGKTPPPPPIPDVEALIDRAESIGNSPLWPYLGSEWSNVFWSPSNQPDTITHVKVRFCADKLKVANSLLVELQPWALVINTLGLNIALQSADKFLCALHHYSILAPPAIEGTFSLVVELHDGYHKSSGLQLSDSQSFYKPQVSGLIPLSDTVQVKVQAPNSVIFAALHSQVVHGVRLLHVSSSYVIFNLSDFDLSVAAFSVRRENGKFRVPSEILSYAVHLPKHTSDPYMGEPLAEWHEIGYGKESTRKLYLIFERDDLVSNPVPVQSGVERGLETALLPLAAGPQINICLEIAFQTREGVTYITVDQQKVPQLVIHNRTRSLLTLARSAAEVGGEAIEESPDWEWRFMLPGSKCGHYKLPLGSPSDPLPALVLAKPENKSWSSSISLTPTTNSRLVSLPHSSDLMATVTKIGFTTHLVLSSASPTLINASDVRTRLDNFQREPYLKGVEEDPIPIFDASDDSLCTDLNNCDSSFWSSVEMTCFFRGITVMICTEPDSSFHWSEVAAFTIDNVGLTAQPSLCPNFAVPQSLVRVTIWDLQVDNQEFPKGGYDFSVVLLRQGEHDKTIFTGNDSSHLVEVARSNSPALDFNLIVNTTTKPVLQEVSVSVAPLQVYVEDTFITNLSSHLTNMLPTYLIIGAKENYPKVEGKANSPAKSSKPVESDEVKLNATVEGRVDEDDLFNVSEEESESPVSTPWTESVKKPREEKDDEDDWAEAEVSGATESTRIPIPDDIVRGAFDLLRPLRLQKFIIAPFDVLVSVHTSTRFYIALDQSPLSFSEFRRVDVVTTTYRLGHALTLHYFLGAIYGTGWALGSLQLLGAPAGLARSVTTGLRSFVTLPFRGIMDGPTGFLLGIVHGSASLMKHVTAGTLSSVTKLAGSWSRTLDRLTLAPADLRYAEEMRRIKPQGLAEGLRQGFTELGVSILGGVGGLAQQPLEYATGGNGGQSLVSSLGRGIVGVMARPLSGAAELVALTAHGILSGAGWADHHIPKHQAICQDIHHGSESRIKYEHKLLPKHESVLFLCEATTIDYQAVVLIITPYYLYVVDRDDIIYKQIKLTDLVWSKDREDPTLVKITVQTPDVVAEKLSKKRIQEFVRESQRALSPDSLPPSPPSTDTDPSLVLFLNPQRRDYFITLLDLAVRHASSRGFPVLV